ncbi:MAG: FHA domain-containing protein [Acidobacteriota bacterium]
MWTLQASEPSGNGLTFRIVADSVKTIGRAAGADFVVDAALVSRVHCRLTLTGDRLEVEDLGSTNGTWVNGTKVARAALAEGDRLTVGRVEFEVFRRA